MWPPSDLLFNRCIPLFFGLRKSSLDFMFWSYIYFSFGRQTSEPKRFICVRWFFFTFLVLFFFFPGGIGFGDVLFAPIYAFIAGHPWWMFFLNASYIPAVLFTIILRERGKSIRKTPIPMGLYFGIGLFFTFLSRIFFESDLAPFTLFSEYSNPD